MNTKTFAQQARKILIKGVKNKLLYWGFDAKGNVLDEPAAVSGGYQFRGQVFDDPAVPPLWQSLRRAVRQKGLETVAEEAAYTWFNRIMAIRILAKNGYEPAQLDFAEGAGRVPLLLQRAQRGTYPFLNDTEKKRLQKVIADHSRETEAFAILLIGYCHHHTLLQTVFGSIDDYTELLLPDDILATYEEKAEKGFLDLLNTTDAISDDDYRQVELIGWLYQFYISEKKDEVFAGFKKNKKAEAADIPAATQIFTPNWIVKYMVQNTVGKLWLDLHPDSPLKANMKYLVEAPEKEEEQAEDATQSSSLITHHSSLIKEVAQLKLLDPAAGSGHILVEGFDLLYEMYLAEYYPPEEAVESTLRNNLFGLDIDKRAAQLAQFALLLKAAARHRDVLKKGLRPNIYAMPEPRPFDRQEVLDFLGKDGLAYADKLFDALHLMQQAQNLGSIMQFDLPEAAVAYIARRWQYFQQAEDLSFHEKTLLPALSAYLPVLLILCDKYEAVVANPPYMGSGNMNSTLKDYVHGYYPLSKLDLFAVFMEVCLALNLDEGLIGMINQHSWMFLSSYEKLREEILIRSRICSMLHLGPRVFDEISGEVVSSVSFVIKKTESLGKGLYYRLTEEEDAFQKEYAFLRRNNRYEIDQNLYKLIPSQTIAYWISQAKIKLFDFVKIDNLNPPKKGLVTLNDEKFIRSWSEVSWTNVFTTCKSTEGNESSKCKWYPIKRGGTFRKWYGNQDHLINWLSNGSEIKDYIMNNAGYHYSRQIQNEGQYYIESISWNSISSSRTSFRYYPSGFLFASSGPSICVNSRQIILKYLGFLNSVVATDLMLLINPTHNFGPRTIGSLPFIENINIDIKLNRVEESILISRRDWDSHETSWDFQQSPLLNHQPNLRRAYEAWQAAVTSDFFQLHANEEELNRIFIGIYGLQDELTPEVALKDITILQEELDGKGLEALEPKFRSQGAAAVSLPIRREVVMQQFISYLMGLCMGRYRLDKPGLHIAHPAPTAGDIASYRYNGHSVEIDEDAILPLMGSECAFPDDAVQRIKHLLDVIWAPDTRTDNLNFLQDCLNSDLEKYMVKQFWKDHCRRYKKKPIYWLFSSPGGAFAVLVYMHRMNAFTAERIRDKYLLPHIKHLRGKVQMFEARSAQLNSQEARQLDRLRKDLSECEAYEPQLKDVADRQIVFDLDDGVTRNYALFEGVVAEIK